MTIAVDWDLKPQTKQTKTCPWEIAYFKCSNKIWDAWHIMSVKFFEVNINLCTRMKVYDKPMTDIMLLS